MDQLLACATSFSKLLDIEYHCIIGRKNNKKEFILAFSSYDFHHLAGLKKLSDVQVVQRNRERVFKDILSCHISLETLSKSTAFPLIEKRLWCLKNLEEFMDSNTIIFSYDTRKNPYSNVEGSFLLQNDIDGDTAYFFLDEGNGSYFGRSFFIKDERDYTIGQSKWTLLYKEKTNKRTQERIVQYDRLTPTS